MTDRELIESAISARESAYAPYSSCKVGAALLTKSGKVYTGCNIENASFSPTCCAERVAFFAAIGAGERDFEKIAVVGGTSLSAADSIFPPCGVCRQVMREFCSDDFRIILGTPEDIHSFTLSELLPYSFSGEMF